MYIDIHTHTHIYICIFVHLETHALRCLRYLSVMELCIFKFFLLFSSCLVFSAINIIFVIRRKPLKIQTWLYTLSLHSSNSAVAIRSSLTACNVGLHLYKFHLLAIFQLQLSAMITWTLQEFLCQA